MENLKPNESVAYEGRIGEVIKTNMPDGQVYERYRRPPGTRTIIVNGEDKLLMTLEHRGESGKVDLRLPGGKVFNTIKEMNNFVAAGGNMDEAVLDGARAEAREEAGMIIHDPKIVAKAIDGTTVEWDLYYILVTDYEEHPDGQDLEAGEEDIETVWLSPEEIIAAIERGEMHEWRSAGVLLGKVLPMLRQ